MINFKKKSAGKLIELNFIKSTEVTDDTLKEIASGITTDDSGSQEINKEINTTRFDWLGVETWQLIIHCAAIEGRLSLNRDSGGGGELPWWCLLLISGAFYCCFRAPRRLLDALSAHSSDDMDLPDVSNASDAWITLSGVVAEPRHHHHQLLSDLLSILILPDSHTTPWLKVKLRKSNGIPLTLYTTLSFRSFFFSHARIYFFAPQKPSGKRPQQEKRDTASFKTFPFCKNMR